MYLHNAKSDQQNATHTSPGETADFVGLLCDVATADRASSRLHNTIHHYVAIFGINRYIFNSQENKCT